MRNFLLYFYPASREQGGGGRGGVGGEEGRSGVGGGGEVLVSACSCVKFFILFRFVIVRLKSYFYYHFRSYVIKRQKQVISILLFYLIYLSIYQI